MDGWMWLIRLGGKKGLCVFPIEGGALFHNRVEQAGAVPYIHVFHTRNGARFHNPGRRKRPHLSSSPHPPLREQGRL